MIIYYKDRFDNAYMVADQGYGVVLYTPLDRVVFTTLKRALRRLDEITAGTYTHIDRYTYYYLKRF